jgi:S-adenosylmethionine synthetase
MNKQDFFFTSESVTEGHPDKLCDQISDGILDDVLRQDPSGRVACETYATMGLIIVGGEITTRAYVDVHQVSRKIIQEIGYNSPKYGLDFKTCAILNAIHAQSPDISQGVDRGGAGDQGMMMGYACDETDELMPLSIILAHKLAARLSFVRKNNILKFLGPDGKSQVTVEYIADKPVRVDSAVLATQHTEEALDKTGSKMKPEARQALIEKIAKPVLGNWIDKKTKFYVNETGKFLIGGPQSDTGMTGRKIIVDTYGGIVPHGGGAFSGKDPSKVDRSAAYMARYIAKNIVAAKLAKKCLIQLAYCIGRADPLSIMVETYGTSKINNAKLINIIRKVFPLTPRGIIDSLDLLRPIYRQTASYGHFGRISTSGFNWERTDKVKEIQKGIK